MAVGPHDCKGGHGFRGAVQPGSRYCGLKGSRRAAAGAVYADESDRPPPEARTASLPMASGVRIMVLDHREGPCALALIRQLGLEDASLRTMTRWSDVR